MVIFMAVPLDLQAGQSAENDPNNNEVDCGHTERLELLEEALKESIAITIQAELQVKIRDESLATAQKKILSLESTLASAASINLASTNQICTDCEGLRNQLRLIGQTLTLLRDQRNKHLEDIFDLKLEALSTAISEIDEQAANLEMSSRSEDRRVLKELREEREVLRQRIREENDHRMKMLQQLDHEARLGSIRTNEDREGNTSSRCGGQTRPKSLIWPSCDDRPALTRTDISDARDCNEEENNKQSLLHRTTREETSV